MSESVEQISKVLALKLADFDATVDWAKTTLINIVAEARTAADPFIGKREAAQFLGWSVKTLERRLQGRDAPPHYIDAGKVQFRRSELVSYRERWRIPKRS